jgi:hypothetical protein
MRNSQTRSQCRAMTTIEEVQFLRQSITQAANYPATDILAYRGSTETFAFKAQECDLVDRIDRSQPGIELQAVNYSDWLAQPDMLRSQIAVPINDFAFANPLRKHSIPPRKKIALHTIHPPDETRRNIEARIQKHLVIVR